MYGELQELPPFVRLRWAAGRFTAARANVRRTPSRRTRHFTPGSQGFAQVTWREASSLQADDLSLCRSGNLTDLRISSTLPREPPAGRAQVRRTPTRHGPFVALSRHQCVRGRAVSPQQEAATVTDEQSPHRLQPAALTLARRSRGLPICLRQCRKEWTPPRRQPRPTRSRNGLPARSGRGRRALRPPRPGRLVAATCRCRGSQACPGRVHEGVDDGRADAGLASKPTALRQVSRGEDAASTGRSERQPARSSHSAGSSSPPGEHVPMDATKSS